METVRTIDPSGVSDSAGRKWWWGVACAVILLGIAARVIVDFSHAYPPGTDAGYYPMQTRSLLVHGRLMYDDLPLIFWIDAALARLLILCGWQFDAAVLAASRLLNAVAHPLVAGAVLGLGYSWSDGRRTALPGCSAAALLSVVSGPVVQAIGFQKASLGLVWMAFALWGCRAAMVHSTWRAWGLVCALVVLAALTHVGAFATTALLLASACGYWFWLKRAKRSGVALLLAVATAAALGALLFYVDPRRAQGLVEGAVLMFVPALFGVGFGLDAAGKALWAVLVVVLLAGARRLRRDRADTRDADLAVAGAVVVTCALLIWPKNAAYFYRLLLMAPLPGAFILAFISARRATRNVSPLPAVLLLGLAIGAAVQSAWMVPPAVVDGRVARELAELRAQIPRPDTTLVVAPHGLEWFAGYFLHTPVRQGPYGTIHRNDLPSDSFARYRRVLLLRFARLAARPSAAADPGMVRVVYAGSALEMYEFIPWRP